MITVPFRKQEKDHTCALASIRMVLEFYGVELTEEEISHVLSVSKETGAANHELVTTAQHHGFFTYVNENTTTREIKKFIKQGVPVIIDYLEPEEDEGHYAVAVDISAGKIVLQDPWFGPGFTLPLDEFVRRWQSKYMPHKQWLLAISNKPIEGELFDVDEK